MQDSNQLNIIVIGASAGGFAAVSRLLATFDDDLNAAIFIVIHISRNSDADIVGKMLQKQTRLHCQVAVDGQTIEKHAVYIAPADHHMMVDTGKILVQKGAYENHYRPSIDVLFRSAAAAYGACVTGIILTGMLDDGTSGMYAIKRSGGICIVQSPEEAEFPNMPFSVINNMQVDHQLNVNEMGPLLNNLLMKRSCNMGEIPEDVKIEAEITRRMSSSPEDLQKLGPAVDLTCPDCGGTLHQIEHDVIPRFRCFTGHAFTAACLEDLQIKSLEESLWTAIRMMEERRNLLVSIHDSSGRKTERAEQLEVHVKRLKAMLKNLNQGE
ncbi:chemotaxis protein CheB [Pedobacter sp. SAFR-022]|uniref:chemotaxis protein CheB n=1 Tax=Pedobacter sp. SAFR-022 TaxID=3436861 RepID=UPI003F8204CD